jgi:hypothetical protein
MSRPRFEPGIFPVQVTNVMAFASLTNHHSDVNSQTHSGYCQEWLLEMMVYVTQVTDALFSDMH